MQQENIIVNDSKSADQIMKSSEKQRVGCTLIKCRRKWCCCCCWELHYLQVNQQCEIYNNNGPSAAAAS